MIIDSVRGRAARSWSTMIALSQGHTNFISGKITTQSKGKRMNKVLKGLVAVVSTAAMAIAGFAGAASATAAEDYSITIAPAKAGHVYEAYQVFTGNLDASTGVLGNVAWGTGIDRNKLNGEGASSLINGKTAAEVSEALAQKSNNSADAKAYAKAFGGVLSETHKDSGAFDAANKAYTISGLAAGYYLIQDETGSVTGDDSYTSFILKVTQANTTVAPKSTTPIVDKKVQDEASDKDKNADNNGWGDTADHGINESFRFKLNATIPESADLADYTKYEVKFTDTMSKGVTFESLDSVKVKGEDASGTDKAWKVAENQYNASSVTAGPTTGDQSWTLTISDVIAACDGINITEGFSVEVVYKAHLNEKATVTTSNGSTDNANAVYLEYSNNPNAEGLGKTSKKKVYVYTFGITNKKVADRENGKLLEGAGFKLYTDTNCEHEYALIWDNTLEAYRPVKTGETGVEMKSNAEGQFPIKGLDAGIYYLKETTTPAGYTTAAVQTVKISATHEVTDNGTPNVTLSSDSTMNNVIVDKSGSSLPSTGGMGTVLLYVAGIAVFALAGVTLVMALRRRNV